MRHVTFESALFSTDLDLQNLLQGCKITQLNILHELFLLCVLQ